MTYRPDSEGETPPAPLSDEEAETLLSGRMEPSAAPPGWAGVAAAFRTARGLPTDDGQPEMESIIDACLELLHAAPKPSAAGRSATRLARVVALAPWTVAAAAVTVVGTTVAAAAGYIPGSGLVPIHRTPGITSTPTAATAGHPGTGQTGASDRPRDRLGDPWVDMPTGQAAVCKRFMMAVGTGSPITGPQFGALISAHGGLVATTVYCKGSLSSPPVVITNATTTIAKPAGTLQSVPGDSRPAGNGSGGSGTHGNAPGNGKKVGNPAGQNNAHSPATAPKKDTGKASPGPNKGNGNGNATTSTGTRMNNGNSSSGKALGPRNGKR